MSSAVLLEVCVERAEQDLKWGGPAHDDEHDDGDWLDFIEDKIGKAYKVRGRRPYDAGERAEYRRRMIQIAALALAAVESIDRRSTGPGDPNDGKTIVLGCAERHPDGWECSRAPHTDPRHVALDSNNNVRARWETGSTGRLSDRCFHRDHVACEADWCACGCHRVVATPAGSPAP